MSSCQCDELQLCKFTTVPIMADAERPAELHVRYLAVFEQHALRGNSPLLVVQLASLVIDWRRNAHLGLQRGLLGNNLAHNYPCMTNDNMDILRTFF